MAISKSGKPRAVLSRVTAGTTRMFPISTITSTVTTCSLTSASRKSQLTSPSKSSTTGLLPPSQAQVRSQMRSTCQDHPCLPLMEPSRAPRNSVRSSKARVSMCQSPWLSLALRVSSAPCRMLVPPRLTSLVSYTSTMAPGPSIVPCNPRKRSSEYHNFQGES